MTMSPSTKLNLLKNAHLSHRMHQNLQGITCKALFQKLSSYFTTVVSPRHWLLSNKKQNFPVYLRTYADNHSSIFEELLQYRFTKKPIYSANIIRYSLLLRYTSIQSYKVLLQDFPLPSLSLLQKISSGTIDAVKCANALRTEGNISKVYVWFLMKCTYKKVKSILGEKWSIVMTKENYIRA